MKEPIPFAKGLYEYCLIHNVSSKKIREISNNKVTGVLVLCEQYSDAYIKKLFTLIDFNIREHLPKEYLEKLLNPINIESMKNLFKDSFFKKIRRKYTTKKGQEFIKHVSDMGLMNEWREYIVFVENNSRKPIVHTVEDIKKKRNVYMRNYNKKKKRKKEKEVNKNIKVTSSNDDLDITLYALSKLNISEQLAAYLEYYKQNSIENASKI